MLVNVTQNDPYEHFSCPAPLSAGRINQQYFKFLVSAKAKWMTLTSTSVKNVNVKIAFGIKNLGSVLYD
jgi:hypothetical protein